MVFITPSFRSVCKRLLCVLMLAFAATVAYAGSIEPKKATLSQSEDGTVLSAEFAIDLGPRLEEAVSRGVPLYFVLEFELTRPRWYWANEYIVNRGLTYRLSYTALTRQYRLSTGHLHRNFDTLNEALRVIAHIVDLPVAERGLLKAGETYNAGVRLALDRNQLPKPFQVDAIANKDWQIDTRVLRWTYVPGAPPAPVASER